MATPNKLPGPALTIKAEPGTSRSSSLRLPSFKPPRDMMLGGPLPNIDVRSARKVYVPNLNVQRKKKEEVEVKVEKVDPKTGNKGARSRGDRGRKPGELVQSTGSVFADGLAKSTRMKKDTRYGEGGGGGGGSGNRSLESKIMKNSIKIGDINTLSKGEADGTSGKLAHLLDDSDFIDDPGICPDDSLKPLELPSYRIKTEPSVKLEVKKPTTIINGLKVKQQPAESVTTVEKSEDPEHITYPQLFRATSPKLILMKLPPGLTIPESNPIDVARPSTSTATPTATASSSVEASDKTPVTGCNLPDGQIGKLQLMKSGMVRFVIGNHVFNSQLGTYTNVKQDVMVLNVHPSGSGGDSINLGPIETHIVSSRLSLKSPTIKPEVQAHHSKTDVKVSD